VLPVLEKLLSPSAASPQNAATHHTDSELRVSVVFTQIEPTLEALREAGKLASRFNASLTLVVAQIVPYPLPLSSPPILLGFNERRFRVVAGQSSVATTVRIYLCRDREEMLKDVLAPHSLVVMGGRKRWWPTAETRLAWTLRRAGHEVVLVQQ